MPLAIFFLKVCLCVCVCTRTFVGQVCGEGNVGQTHATGAGNSCYLRPDTWGADTGSEQTGDQSLHARSAYLLVSPPDVGCVLSYLSVTGERRQRFEVEKDANVCSNYSPCLKSFVILPPGHRNSLKRRPFR